MTRFKTNLCDLLGVEYPVLQSGMGGVAGPELVAEVSRAGGLGILAGLRLTGDQLRAAIRRVRELTDRPFGVNLWLHTELMPPADVSKIPEATLRQVQDTLNRFRTRLGIATKEGRPAAVPDLIREAFEVILDERVPVWSIGLGNPDPGWVQRCHERGVKIVAMVATVDDARAVAGSGVDAVIAQGAEAGGHRSTWVKPASREAAQIGALALVPQIVDAVKVPVIAAGGIADGRGLLAALALGAQGIWMGTRFVASIETYAHVNYKNKIVETDEEGTTITRCHSGKPCRLIRNKFTESWIGREAEIEPFPLQSMKVGFPLAEKARYEGKIEEGGLACGQTAGLIHSIKPAGQIVRDVMEDAAHALEERFLRPAAQPGVTASA